MLRVCHCVRPGSDTAESDKAYRQMLFWFCVGI